MKRIISSIMSIALLLGVMMPLSANASSYIGKEKAKSIAISNAGVDKSMVTITKAVLDIDDGIKVYEVEFHTALAEYEYDIDAVSGKIMDKDTDLKFTISLSSNAYTYDGKTKKPTVTLSKNGKQIGKSNYTISYADNTNPGKGKVTIRFNNKKYTGKFIRKFKIKPKKQKIKSVKRTGNKLTIKWTRDKLVSGYQIQYGTHSDFSNAKSIRISGNSNVSRTINGVGTKKYYARIRAYKKIGTERIYGAWSANGKSSSYIGISKAKQIALNDAGLKASQVTFTTAKLDTDDGIKVYEIEFLTKSREYEYEINAITGNIIDKDIEIR